MGNNRFQKQFQLILILLFPYKDLYVYKRSLLGTTTLRPLEAIVVLIGSQFHTGELVYPQNHDIEFALLWYQSSHI